MNIYFKRERGSKSIKLHSTRPHNTESLVCIERQLCGGSTSEVKPITCEILFSTINLLLLTGTPAMTSR